MPSLTIHANGENCWPDLADIIGDPTKVMHISNVPIAVARLPGGMRSGASSVTIRAQLPDGRVLLLETSLALFVSAANAMEGAEAHDAAQVAGKGTPA